MVDTEMVKRKLAKGLTTGVGVFASSYVGNTIESQFDLSGNGIAATQLALGAGLAVGSERLGGLAGQRTGADDSLLEIGIEHVGYGIHGAGFAELADNVQTGQSADRVVAVRARADDANNTSEQNNEATEAGSSYSLDTA